MLVDAIGIQPVPATQNTPQQKEASTNTNGTDSSTDIQNQFNEAIASMISMQAFSMMLQNGAMVKNAMSKGGQATKEFMVELEEEDRGNEVQFS